MSDPTCIFLLNFEKILIARSLYLMVDKVKNQYRITKKYADGD